MKVCFVASSGGHIEELSKIKRVIHRNPNFLVTEKCKNLTNNFCDKVYYVPQTNRKEFFFPLKMIYLFFRAIFILFREKPGVVISTGALIAYPFCVIAKAMRKKVIYIESFARVNDLSLTGKLLYKIVDLFIVQWEDLVAKYPKAVVGGGIF